MFAGLGAALAASKNDYVQPHTGPCWHYSHSAGHWVHSCGTYAYRHVYPENDGDFPGFIPGYYPFQYQPPPGSNGPYYGFEPYNGFESALGVWW
jgi:hypothetical protein